MNIILSFVCIQCLVLILSETAALKLIPGDQNVVKKDGATHTISKYYVVPNDFEVNNDANNKRFVKNMNQELVEENYGSLNHNNQAENYRNMNQDIVNEDHYVSDDGRIEEYRMTVNNNGSGLSEIQTAIFRQGSNDGSSVASESWASVSNTLRALDTDSTNLGNIQIEHIPIPEHVNEIPKKQVTTESESDFDSVVSISFYKNFESFWNIFSNYVETVSDKREQVVRIEKLFLLLNIFTSLNEATELQIPIDGIIDGLVNVLQSADTTNTNSSEHGPQNNNTKLIRECQIKCLQKNSKANLDSKGVSISETDDLQNDNLDSYLQRRGIENDQGLLVNLHQSNSDPNKPLPSNVLYDIQKPVTIQRSTLVNPNFVGALKGVPDGFNVRFAPIAVSKQKHIIRENSDSDDTEDTSKLPYTLENEQNRIDPRFKEDINYNDLPWHIENKDNIPVRFQASDGSGLTISDDKILLDSNRTPLTNSVNGVTVKNRFGKPYLYTYVINPTKFVYRGPDKSSNIVKILSGKYNNNYETDYENGYDVYNKYNQDGDSKVVLINKPSGYYESELSLSEEPTFVVGNEPGYYSAQLQIEKDINLSKGNNNPLFLVTNSAPESKLKIELEKETESNPLFFTNSPSYESNVKLEVEKQYSVPSTQKLEADYEFMLPNVPSTHELNLNINGNDDLSQLIDETETYIDTVSPSVAPSNYYEPGLDTNILPYNNPTLLHPNKPTHEYIKIEKEYNSPIYDNAGGLDINPELLYVHPLNGQSVAHPTVPSVTYLQPNQQPEYNYFDSLDTNLAPSYQLFAIENLLKLHEALIKKQQINNINIYEDKALSNLKKINIILLKLAEYLGDNELSNKWYEKIFYNLHQPRHPLQVYVYNLLRQKWLHEIMLILYQNNFNLNILNNPKLHSFLKTWTFPTEVLNFLEVEESLQEHYIKPNIFEDTFGAKNVLQEDIKILEEKLVKQEVLDKIETETVVDDYVTQNEGIILSITGYKAGLDASAIIDILKKYLLYKNYIEKQEHIINRGNKIEMFKQIALFLNEKGYEGRTIIDLIRKLYGAVYSVEGGSCGHTHYNDFVRNAYNVIVPVLRRSGH